MTPDWKDAPEWANWLAMDEGDRWYWFANVPHYDSATGEWASDDDRFTFAGPSLIASASLQERPQ